MGSSPELGHQLHQLALAGIGVLDVEIAFEVPDHLQGS